MAGEAGRPIAGAEVAKPGKAQPPPRPAQAAVRSIQIKVDQAEQAGAGSGSGWLNSLRALSSSRARISSLMSGRRSAIQLSRISSASADHFSSGPICASIFTSRAIISLLERRIISHDLPFVILTWIAQRRHGKPTVELSVIGDRCSGSGLVTALGAFRRKQPAALLAELRSEPEADLSVRCQKARH